MTATAGRLAGAVLVGGRSRRMGADKALIDVGGRPMGRRVIEALLEGGCDPVVAIGGRSDHEHLGVEVLPDRVADQGPLMGIATAVGHAAHGGASAVVVVSCDVPDLDAATVAALGEAWTESMRSPSPAEVIVARSDRLEPLCAVWSTSIAPSLDRLLDLGTRAVHAALDPFRVVEVSVPPEVLRDLDTPEALSSRRRSGGG